MKKIPSESELLQERLRHLGLWGLLAHFADVDGVDWLETVIQYEEQERSHRSLQRRLKNGYLGSFKPIVDFDWTWPKKLDREIAEELFTLRFMADGANALLIGPNGVGKTMIAKNLAHQAVVRGCTARFVTASDMLNDLAAQDSDLSLARRLRRYCNPSLLCVDEVGYLSYNARYADLLFEVVTRRYNDKRSIILTTNKPFAEWTDVFPNAACVVTLVDRLIHRSEILTIEGNSYRLHEAKQRADRRKRQQTKSSTVKGSTEHP